MLKLEGTNYKSKHNSEIFFLLSLYFPEITSIIIEVISEKYRDNKKNIYINSKRCKTIHFGSKLFLLF